MQNEPTMRQFNVHGAYYTMYNHSRTDEYAQAYSTRVWLSQLTQTTCTLIFNSRLYFRMLWWYIGLVQPTRLIRSAIVRLTL